ncbi:SdpI family protein [Dehalobacter sp. UNSWDHB]|uniref:SdpI family protein n=1 Tax=Dehalobacter sp. UNSWDHB TaxID=1339256 RepID=UPI000417FB3E|nr:SdpI family protein [Dehalobacter sp. UNSWDHB]
MSENKELWMRRMLIFGSLMVLISLAVSLVVYPRLPDKVPVHWNAAGEIDGWGSAFQGAFLFPLMMAAMLILLVFLPKVDPKKKNYSRMSKPYTIIVLVIMLFFMLIHFGSLGTALGYFNSFPSLIQLGVGALFVIIGNYMGKLKHNYFAGIKTPWTLANEQVWYKTHRMAGPLWVIGGLIFMAASFLPSQFLTVIVMIVIALLLIVPIGYSYWIFKRLDKEE